MAVSLLRYANREAVAQALTEQGYSVTRQTVNRWARGDEMPSIAARMVASLFGHAEPFVTEPPWARRLLAGQALLLQRAGVSRDEFEAELDRLVETAADELERMHAQ